jgi:chromosome segregation ATPase
LTNAQQLLNQQSSKLTEASSLLAKNAESLQTLRTQIQALEHKLAVIKRQRDAWAVLAGGLVGYIAFDKISKK